MLGSISIQRTGSGPSRNDGVCTSASAERHLGHGVSRLNSMDVYRFDHNNDRNAALRLCALKVAAMIGEDG